MRQICKSTVIFLLKGYQLLVSPILGPSCRFMPSCSQFAIDAFNDLPTGLACWLVLKRLIRCQPLCKGGYDPVPMRKKAQ